MAVLNSVAVSERTAGLIEAGRSPDTPVLIAVNVSLPGERLIRGRLSALPFLTRAISDDDPTLLLIGEATRATAVAVAASAEGAMSA